MTRGSLLLTCLLLVSGAEPSDPVHLNTPKFSIPITIKPERRADIRTLELWMSRDRGQSWEKVGQAAPEQSSFPVTAPGEGMYWYTVVVVDNQGRREPPGDLKTVPAEMMQRVVVDTVRPDIKLTAERQGDEILVSWDIKDDNLDTKTMRMTWVQAGGSPIAAPILYEPRGQTRIKPLDPQQGVSVQMNAADMAGNPGMGTVEVQPAQITPPGSLVGNYKPAVPPLTDMSRPPDFPPPPPPVNLTPPPGTLATTPSGTQLTRYNPSSQSGSPDYTSTTAVNPMLPPLQIVNKRQVKLEFEVAKYGPTGLAAAGDVWVTMDDGRTWEKSQLEPGAWLLPGSVGGIGPLHGSVTVQMNKEGVVYGFYLIVKSRALLGKAPPRTGDAPQVRVELDTTAPFAELREPQVDPAQPNALILSWTATDSHLAARPITLEWAAQKEGPWKGIGEPAMQNTGRCLWQITNDIPPMVFLRLTVRDVAGNTAVAETDKPVLVDLTIPDLGPVINLQVGPR